MKLIIILATGLLLSSVSVLAQTAPATPKPVPAPKPVMTKDSPVGSDLSESIVRKFCTQIIDELDKDTKNYNRQSYQNYTMFSHRLNQWLNYQFLELDSDTNRSWFIKIQEFLVFFHNTKRAYDRSLEAETSKNKITSKKNFELGVEHFKKFMEQKPPKANSQRIDYLKREKEKYLKEKRAKERATSTKNRLFD